MIKKTIKYVDYNGVERTEDFHFNLNKAEIIEMEVNVAGGLTEMINRAITAQDNPTIYKVFKDFLRKAYGEKSPDGKYFLKEDQDGYPLYKKFEQTEAYAVLISEFVTDSKAGAEFFNAVISGAKTAAAADPRQNVTPIATSTN